MAITQDYSLRKKVFAAAWVVIFVAAGISAYFMFKASIMEATSGTDSQMSIAYTIQQLFAATLGIFSGRAVSKIGPGIMIYLGDFLYGFGWLVGGLTTSVPVFYLFFGTVGEVGSELTYNSSVAAGLKWCPEKKGTMSRLLPMSAFIRPFLTSRFGGILCNGLELGAKGLSVIGTAYIVLVWTVGWIMTVSGKDWMAPPIPAFVMSAEKADREYGPFDMLKILRFWMMIVPTCLTSITGIMFAGALSGIAQAQLEVGTATASWIAGISALANFMGRMGFGRTCDRLGKAKTVLIILVVAILPLFVMRNTFTISVFIVCLIFIGAAFGRVLVCFPPFTQKVFGVESSGVNYGIMFLGCASGSCFGPQIMARTKVLGPDGAMIATPYVNTYSIAIAVGVTGTVVYFLLIYAKDRYAKRVKAV